MSRSSARWWAFGLLLLPVCALIWPPLYNRIDPKLFGIPFFYAWQTLWIALSAILTGLAGRLLRGTQR